MVRKTLSLACAPAFGYQTIEAVEFPESDPYEEEVEARCQPEEELVSGRKKFNLSVQELKWDRALLDCSVGEFPAFYLNRTHRSV